MEFADCSKIELFWGSSAKSGNYPSFFKSRFCGFSWEVSCQFFIMCYKVLEQIYHFQGILNTDKNYTRPLNRQRATHLHSSCVGIIISGVGSMLQVVRPK
jgi:hypothetical protein